MRILAVVAVAALLCGCSTMGMTPEQVAQLDHDKCVSYGFKQGTDAYAVCRQNVELSREADNRDRRAAMRNLSSTLLNDNSVTCHTTASSFGSMGHATTTCR